MGRYVKFARAGQSEVYVNSESVIYLSAENERTRVHFACPTNKGHHSIVVVASIADVARELEGMQTG
jgi:hypothetical protein